MPVKAVKRGTVYRVVESRTGKISTTSKGNARDGGGKSRAAAIAQVNAINLSERRRAGKSAPPPPRRKR